jgi:hypothetical protein
MGIFQSINFPQKYKFSSRNKFSIPADVILIKKQHTKNRTKLIVTRYHRSESMCVHIKKGEIPRKMCVLVPVYCQP